MTVILAGGPQLSGEQPVKQLSQDEWTVFSQTKTGVLTYQFPVVQDLKYNEILNAPGACTFRLPNRPLPDGRPIKEVLEPGVHEVGIYRGTTLVWLGPVWTIAVEAFNQGYIEVGCEGLASYFTRWFVEGPIPGSTTDYTPNPDDGENPFPPGRLVNVDQFVILKALIDHHQAKAGGNFFIDTSQVGTSGVLRTRTYDPLELPNVGEMVENLSNVINGFDYAVTPDRVLRAWYPRRGIRRRDLVLSRFTEAPTRLVDGTQLASAVLGVGAGEGEDMLRYSRRSQAAVKRIGLLQTVYSNKDVSEERTLREQVNAEAARFQQPAQEFTAKVRMDEADRIELGDEVRLLYEDGYDNVDTWVRVVGKEMEPTTSTVSLVFAKEETI